MGDSPETSATKRDRLCAAGLGTEMADEKAETTGEATAQSEGTSTETGEAPKGNVIPGKYQIRIRRGMSKETPRSSST